MATYNKRGYKAPKPKEDKIDNEFIDDVAIDATDSTTAGVFNSLDDANAWGRELLLSTNSRRY